jgi:hypothetical protein
MAHRDPAAPSSRGRSHRFEHAWRMFADIVDRQRRLVIERRREKRHAPHEPAEIYASSLPNRNLEALLAPPLIPFSQLTIVFTRFLSQLNPSWWRRFLRSLLQVRPFWTPNCPDRSQIDASQQTAKVARSGSVPPSTFHGQARSCRTDMARGGILNA